MRAVRTKPRASAGSGNTPRNSDSRNQELVRQASDALLRFKSLDANDELFSTASLGGNGSLDLDKLLGQIEWETGTPRAGSMLEEVVQSGLPGIPNDLREMLRTGTPRGSLREEDVLSMLGNYNLPEPAAPSAVEASRTGAFKPLAPSASAAAKSAAASGGALVIGAGIGAAAGAAAAEATQRVAAAAARQNRKQKRKAGDAGIGAVPAAPIAVPVGLSLGGVIAPKAAKASAVPTPSSNNSDDGEDDGNKRKRPVADPTDRVLNNRASARRSRERKMQYQRELEDNIAKLEEKNAKLESDKKALEAKVDALQKQLKKK